MEKGDVVAVTNGMQVIALALILGDRMPITGKPEMEDFVTAKAIPFEEWNFTAPACFLELNGEQQFQYAQRKGICEIRNSDALEKINELLPQLLKKASKEVRMAKIAELTDLLKSNHNLVLTGAPGTGKTWLAREIAQSMLSVWEMVQFHPSYDYTDFVEGLRPVKKAGQIAFERQDGKFKQFCKKALKDPGKPFVFIIDEINRGEIAKIFGELFYSIESGYRGKKGLVSTQYQNLVRKNDEFADGFHVPANVYILATMNDIDRNVETMDFAIRRRFAWREISADESQTILDEPASWQSGSLPTEIRQIKNRMTNLNKALADQYPDTQDSIRIGLDTDFQLGAAYFLKYSSCNDFERLWKLHIEGVLREYLRGQPQLSEKLAFLKKAYDDDSSHNYS